MHARTLPGNPYDGHTLGAVIEAMAVKTNVLGTENVLEVAITNGVRQVVCPSTDKAVYSIMPWGAGLSTVWRDINLTYSYCPKACRRIG